MVDPIAMVDPIHMVTHDEAQTHGRPIPVGDTYVQHRVGYLFTHTHESILTIHGIQCLRRRSIEQSPLFPCLEACLADCNHSGGKTRLKKGSRLFPLQKVVVWKHVHHWIIS